MRKIIPIGSNQHVNQPKYCLKYLSKIYDTTLDNFPLTSFISVVITIVSVYIGLFIYKKSNFKKYILKCALEFYIK